MSRTTTGSHLHSLHVAPSSERTTYWRQGSAIQQYEAYRWSHQPRPAICWKPKRHRRKYATERKKLTEL